MPYTIEKNDEGEFCVYKESGGESFGCHETREEAVAQIGAIESEERKSVLCIKSLGENRIGGYGILWGDENSRDLHGEYFTSETEDILAIFKTMGKIPYIVEHAADDAVKSFVAAEVDVMEPDETGLWWEAKILDHQAYRNYVRPLIQREALYSSSGTLPAAKRVDPNGKITRWPVAEMTGTVTPAEWRMLEKPIEEIQGHYKSIGLKFLDETSDEESETEGQGIEKMRLSVMIKQSELAIQLSGL